MSATNLLSRVLRHTAQRTAIKSVGNRCRFLHNASSAKDWQLQTAIAFDIDGVLVKGKHVLDEGCRALQILSGDNPTGKHIPFVLLTNGGGVPEEVKAAEISKRLGVEISPNQVVLAHSPMRALATQYADKHILIIGGKKSNCAHIARSYGFGNVSTPNDVVAWQPSSWPYIDPPTGDLLSGGGNANRDYANDPFHAVLVFHDSFDFGRDLQVATDILRSKNGSMAGEFTNQQQLPLYMSNEDLIYSNEFPNPRFGQGAYHVCLRAMWSALTDGASLKYTMFGKPHRVQYRYAEKLFDQLAMNTAPQIDLPQLQSQRQIYAIGDNPAADIAGANRAGWTSVLVRTGVFSGDNHHKHPAYKVVDHVEDAVNWIIENELERSRSSSSMQRSF